MADLAHEGNYRVSFVPGTPGFVNMNTPTVAELNAGIEMEVQLTPTGLSREAATDRKDTSKLNSTFGTQSVGRRNFTLSTTAVREVGDVAGIEAALVYKALGFLVIRDNLPATTAYASTQKVEVYPVQVDQPNKASPAVNEDQQITYTFAMTGDPNLAAVVAP